MSEAGPTTTRVELVEYVSLAELAEEVERDVRSMLRDIKIDVPPGDVYGFAEALVGEDWCYVGAIEVGPEKAIQFPRDASPFIAFAYVLYRLGAAFSLIRMIAISPQVLHRLVVHCEESFEDLQPELVEVAKGES